MRGPRFGRRGSGTATLRTRFDSRSGWLWRQQLEKADGYAGFVDCNSVMWMHSLSQYVIIVITIITVAITPRILSRFAAEGP